MRIACILASLVAAGCFQSDRASIRVLVSHIPADAKRLEARFTLDGRAAMAPATWDAPAGGFHQSESFVVVPPATAGTLGIEVSALDDVGCTSLAGDASAQLEPGSRDVSIALTSGARVGCPLHLDVQGPGNAAVLGTACHQACTVIAPKGANLTLAATPDPDGAFVTWGDACAGDADCSVMLTAPRAVRATFAPRGLLFARAIGGDAEDWLDAVAVDSAGNIVAVGAFGSPSVDVDGFVLHNAGEDDALVVELDPAGHVRWARSFGGPGNDSASAVAVASDGRIFVAGTFSATVDFGVRSLTTADADAFLLVLSPDGAPLRATAFGGPNVEVPIGLALDAGGGALISGYESGPFPAQHAILASLRPDGTVRWSKTFVGSPDDGTTNSSLGEVVTTGAGDVVVAGSFQGTLDFGMGPLPARGLRDGVVLSYNADGNPRWVAPLGTTDDDLSRGIALAKDGSVIACGTFRGTISFGNTTLAARGLQDAYVAVLDPSSGSARTALAVSSPLADDAVGLAVGQNGEVIATGFYAGVGPSSDSFVAWIALEPTPSLERIETLGAMGTNPGTVATDKGNVVAVGSFFDPISPDGMSVRSHGAHDGWIIKWSR